MEFKSINQIQVQPDILSMHSSCAECIHFGLRRMPFKCLSSFYADWDSGRGAFGDPFGAGGTQR